MAKLGEIEVNLFASVESGDPENIGRLYIPVKAGAVVRTENGVRLPVNIDYEELRKRMHEAVDEMADALAESLSDSE